MNFIKKILQGSWSILFITVMLLFVNMLASTYHSRIDLTNEKRFTLSNSTKQLLKKIEQPLKIEVLLKGNLPSGFKSLASSAEDILREFKEETGANLFFHFVSPDETFENTAVTFADTLSSMGFFPINLTSQLKDGQEQKMVYPIAILYYENKIVPIELYKGKTPLINFQELSSAEAMLEYNLSSGIAKLIQKQKATVGYAIGNGEPVDMSVYDLSEIAIQPNYTLQLINIMEQPFINPSCSVLLIVKPTIFFSDAEKLKIDQYIMHGGKVIFFIDRLNAEMDSLQIKNEVIAFDRGLNLDDMLFKYGVRINADLLMDLQCDYLPFDVNGNGQYDFLPWNYFPVLESSGNHPINKNLGFVSGRFTNTIDTIQTQGIKKDILLHSSVNARTISSPAIISGRENVAAPEDEKYKKSTLPVAVLMQGKFKSLFANRLTNSLRDSMNENGMTFYTESENDNKIMVVSDADIVLNSFVKGNQPIAMGMNSFTYGTQREFPFANRDFLLNSIEFMINENGLSEAKSKDYVVRLLDSKKVNESKSLWQAINLVIPLILILFFGMVFQWIRKRKYTA